MKIFLLLTVLLFASCCAAPDSKYAKAKRAKDSVSIRVDKAAKIVVDKIDEALEEDEPIPKSTKYKVSDIVCAWGKNTGTVVGIRWSTKTPEGHERVLVYEIRYDITSPAYAESEEGGAEFYETELERGKCN